MGVTVKELKVKVYQFDELSEEAKEKARGWFREGAFDYEWYDSTYEDAKEIGLEIVEFDITRNTIGGHLTIGAREVCQRILKEHGESCNTYKLALENKDIDEDDEDAVKEFEYALLEEYLAMLRQEADYICSNESVDENIRANEYGFTVDGKRQVTI